MIQIPRQEVLDWANKTFTTLKLRDGEREALWRLFEEAPVAQTGTFEPRRPLYGPDAAVEGPGCPVYAAGLDAVGTPIPGALFAFANRFDRFVWDWARERGTEHCTFGLVELTD